MRPTGGAGAGQRLIAANANVSDFKRVGALQANRITRTFAPAFGIATASFASSNSTY